MIGIVIPAHNEAEHIGATLAAVTQAATHPALHGEMVRVMVVLDSCDDATGAIAETYGAAHGVKTDQERADFFLQLFLQGDVGDETRK